MENRHLLSGAQGACGSMSKAKITFDKVDLMLVDHDLNARQSIRLILNNNGFREIRIGDTLARVKDVLSMFMPDILLCSATIPDGDFCDFVYDLRHDKIGNNPFLPIIALLDEPTPEMVKRILEVGTDDICMKPVSTTGMLERINILINHRKPFIVTEGYVGPARKGDDLSKAVEVPNTLQAKATGKKVGFFDVEAGIQATKTKLEDKKLEFIGAELAALVTKLVPMMERNPAVNDVVVGGLETLIDEAEASIKRLEGSRYSHVIELCRALIDVSRSIQKSKGELADTREVALLKPLSQSVQACFSGAINTVEMAQAIVKQITGRGS